MHYSNLVTNWTRSPEQWARDIESLDADVREDAAKIIWWDFFADRRTGDRWNHLDKYLNRPCIRFKTLLNTESPHIEVHPKRMARALMQLGYEEKLAYRRSRLAPMAAIYSAKFGPE